MTRLLLVPAAGSGSRLGSPLPKLLTPVAGRAMIDHLLDRYRAAVQAVVVVVQPSTRAVVASHLRGTKPQCALAEQAAPTGMLDAILAGWNEALMGRPDRIWITWCDQVGISASTVSALQEFEVASPDAELIMPVVEQPAPYIHFDRDANGRLAAVRHRREGDDMPATGTSDAGLFSLSRDAFEHWLPIYARTAHVGTRTGERNFLPFVPWLAAKATVRTFEIPVDEAQGINTPEDLAEVERRLQSPKHQA